MSIDRAAFIVTAVAIGLASGFRSDAAHAQTGDASAVATRRQLIENAQVARDHGDHATALASAERAASLRSSGTLRRFVAEELLALGRFAEALGAAEQCETELNADPQLRTIAVHHRACREVARAARQHVGTVVVRVPTPPPEGLSVRVAGTPLAQVLWGAPSVVSAGHVVIDASANGWRPFHLAVEVSAGAIVPVTIEMIADETPPTTTVTPEEPNATTPTIPSEPVRDPIARPVPEPQGTTARHSNGLGAGAVALIGGAGLAIGMFVWGSTIAADYYRRCNVQMDMFERCSAEHDGLQATVDLLSVAGIAGVVIAAGGVVLMLRGALSGNSNHATPSVRRGNRWRLGVTHTGVVVGGTW